MELRARKNRPSPELVEPSAEQAFRSSDDSAPATPSAATGDENSEVTIRLDRMLYERLQNSIQASHTAGDFSFVSVSDVIRAAIEAYRDGMELTELAPRGGKKNYTLRVTAPLRAFYNTLPNRLKSQIIERAIRTYIKERMNV